MLTRNASASWTSGRLCLKLYGSAQGKPSSWRYTVEHTGVQKSMGMYLQQQWERSSLSPPLLARQSGTHWYGLRGLSTNVPNPSW